MAKKVLTPIKNVNKTKNSEEIYYCDNCGIILTKKKYKKGKGLCPICIDTIN